MGKKKTETKQTQSYNTQQASATSVPDTPDIQKYRDFSPQIDPTIGFRTAEQKNQLRSNLNNPIGGYYSANTRDAIQRAGERSIDQDAAQQFRVGQYDVNQQRGGQLGLLAALTRGSNTTGTSSGTGQGTSTTTQSGGLLEQILGAAAQVGAGFLTGGASAAGAGALGGGKNRGSAPTPSIFSSHELGH